MTANETKLDASMLDEVDDPSLFMKNGWLITPLPVALSLYMLHETD